MKRIKKFAGALLLCAALTAAGQIPSPEVAAIVARSQEALDRNDDQQDLGLIQAGLGLNPGGSRRRRQDRSLEVWRCRVAGLAAKLGLVEPSYRGRRYCILRSA